MMDTQPFIPIGFLQQRVVAECKYSFPYMATPSLLGYRHYTYSLLCTRTVEKDMISTAWFCIVVNKYTQYLLNDVQCCELCLLVASTRVHWDCFRHGTLVRDECDQRYGVVQPFSHAFSPMQLYTTMESTCMESAHIVLWDLKRGNKTTSWYNMISTIAAIMKYVCSWCSIAPTKLPAQLQTSFQSFVDVEVS